jgi:hypothetical protein
VDKSQQHINSLVERKKAEEIEKARKKAEQEEIKRVKDLEKARIAEEGLAMENFNLRYLPHKL